MEIETIEVFQSSYLEGTDQKVAHFDQLRNWLKIGVNIRLLINFFQPASRLLIDNLFRDFKIELIFFFLSR